IRAARPRFAVTKEHGLEIAAAFFAASRNGDMDPLRSLLAEDVTASTDGGGKVPAPPRPLIGIAEVMARHGQLAKELHQSPSLLLRYAGIDGLAGYSYVEGGGIVQSIA